MRRVRDRRAAFVLVCLAGILALLLLTTLSFLFLARLRSAGSSAASARHRARLAAASGMEYAAARLLGEGYPRASVFVPDRGDDLIFREGAGQPLAGAKNPSYSHGEYWTDDGDGVFEPGESWTDADADGRFTARTGRLRGADTCFSLAIGVEAGKLPVNAGYLGAGDRDGDLVPDCSDFDVHPYHKGFATAIDSLGAILDVETRRTPAPGGSSPLPDDWIRPCWLGQDLLSARPPEGYGDLDEVDLALASFGYTPAERAAVLPHLGIARGERLGEWGRIEPDDGLDAPLYIPVNLATASREVLAAHWLHLGVRGFSYGGLDLMGALPGFLAHTSRRGPPIAPTFWYRFGHSGSMMLIFRDEALALADRTIQLRLLGPVSWRAFRQDLAVGAPVIFARDYLDLFPVDPLYAQVWTQAKAELAFRTVSPDPHPFGIQEGSAAWAGWGVDRFLDDPLVPWTIGVQQYHSFPFWGIRRAAYPAAPGVPWDLASQPTEPHRLSGTELILPQGLSLAPPDRYAVASLGLEGGSGASARQEGVLRSLELLEFTSQEDFENLSGGPWLAGRGIGVLETAIPDPAARHDWRASDPLPDGTSPLYPNNRPRVQSHVITHPRWNRRSVADTATGLGPDYQGYHRMYGAVTLATREQGHQGSKLYWPFKEDFDGLLNAGGVPSIGSDGDFWSENGPGGSSNPVLYPIFLYDGIYGSFPVGWPVDDPFIGTPTSPDAGNLPVDLSFAFQCPGIGPPHVSAFSIECWMGPGSRWSIEAGSQGFGLNIVREPDTRLGSLFTLTPTNISGGGTIPVWFVEDGDNPENRSSWHYHVVLTVEGDGSQATFRLYVNGKGIDSDGVPMTVPWGPLDMPGPDEWLDLHDCDEVRLYDMVLQQADADVRYRNDRFVRRGVFLSPLYVLDAPGRLSLAQWTGIVPPENAFSTDCLSVEMVGYSDAGGTIPSGAAVPCPTSGPVYALSALGTVRSFRYKVTFDCAAVSAVLDDTPVFESLWLAFRRRGHTPVWHSWK